MLKKFFLCSAIATVSFAANAQNQNIRKEKIEKGSSLEKSLVEATFSKSVNYLGSERIDNRDQKKMSGDQNLLWMMYQNQANGRTYTATINDEDHNNKFNKHDKILGVMVENKQGLNVFYELAANDSTGVNAIPTIKKHFLYDAKKYPFPETVIQDVPQEEWDIVVADLGYDPRKIGVVQTIQKKQKLQNQ